MNASKGIILATLIFPGLILLVASIQWFNLDYIALARSERYVEKLVREGRTDDRQLDFAYHRTTAQRINVVTDQVWGLIGGVITAIGIHGLASQTEEKIQDRRTQQ